MQKDLLGIPISIIDTDEYKELEKREYTSGPDQLLEEILAKKLFSNAEIMWILRRMVYFYGHRDALLKQSPPERLLLNMNNLLRAFYILFDLESPDMDDNIRSYISARLTDATWGVSQRTRAYLYKIN
ncbi:MAG: hypothetical protein GX133_09910 [Syntrophomonadaceae bacterium]|nr:hypothetical protein [Syntrophomonadaceae bacterium]